MEGQWKFRGGGGSQKPKFFKESMGLNWSFQRGGGIQTKKPSMGGVWIFTGTTHFQKPFLRDKSRLVLEKFNAFGLFFVRQKLQFYWSAKANHNKEQRGRIGLSHS